MPLKTFSVLALLTVCAAACQTNPPDIGAHEDALAAAGFIMKPANTPQRQSMLARLPQNEFVIRTNNGVTHYVYADALVCGCLYVGTQQAYDQYRTNQRQRHIADERQRAALAYSDEAWQWEAWGPVTPGFGFVYGPMGW
jgi:hypothetical protein